MGILVNVGHAAIAKSIKDRTVHFAWGRGESWWNQPYLNNHSFAGSPQQIALPHAPVASVVLKNTAGTVTYVDGVDFTWSASSGAITRIPTGAIPSNGAVSVEAVFGRPDTPSNLSAMVDEIGRRRAGSLTFVVPDSNGELETADGNKWTVSESPTRWLYMSVLFGFGEAPNETVREVGVFIDTVAAEGVPQGQDYLLPSEVDDPGILLIADRVAPIVRSPSLRQGFTYVVSF